MPIHIGLLRAVNVGKRQLPMAALREWLTEAGFAEVETYIQTGNVKVVTPMRSSAKVGAELERAIAAQTGFDVPCIMLTPRELTQVYADAEALDPPSFAGDPTERRFVVFFAEPVPEDVAAAFAAYDAPSEWIRAAGRAVHVRITGSFQDAKVFGVFAKQLASGTNRNLKVTRTLAERWGA